MQWVCLGAELYLYQADAPINVLPHPPPCGQTLGIGGDLPTFEDIASSLGQITKVKLHPIPSYCIWGYVGICFIVATLTTVR